MRDASSQALHGALAVLTLPCPAPGLLFVAHALEDF